MKINYTNEVMSMYLSCMIYFYFKGENELVIGTCPLCGKKKVQTILTYLSHHALCAECVISLHTC